MRKWVQTTGVISCLVLAGCDETVEISHLDRMHDMVLEELWKIQDPRGIPVEVHGSPFHRITDSDLVAALKAPAETPQDISFYVIPAGSAETGYPWRLILHFNPQGPPNASRDCGLTEKSRTNALPDNGFSMNVAFCKGKVWKAQGFMQVREIEDGDREAFTKHFQSLLTAIFEADPKR